MGLFSFMFGEHRGYQEIYIHSVPGFGGGWVPVLFMPQVRIARLVPEYDLKMDFKEMIVQSVLGH